MSRMEKAKVILPRLTIDAKISFPYCGMASGEIVKRICSAIKTECLREDEEIPTKIPGKILIYEKSSRRAMTAQFQNSMVGYEWNNTEEILLHALCGYVDIKPGDDDAPKGQNVRLAGLHCNDCKQSCMTCDKLLVRALRRFASKTK